VERFNLTLERESLTAVRLDLTRSSLASTEVGLHLTVERFNLTLERESLTAVGLDLTRSSLASTEVRFKREAGPIRSDQRKIAPALVILGSNELTAIIELDDDWFIAFSPEIPSANGQGRSKEERLESLAAAITLILADRREDGRGGGSPGPSGPTGREIPAQGRGRRPMPWENNPPRPTA
jgi:predicted RNase H-like HicB family nuclease